MTEFEPWFAHATGHPAPRQMWGKAAGDPGDFHPALCHMLDVGAVALELLTMTAASARTRSALRPTEQGPPCTPQHIAALVALHDLGKLSPGFQAKVDVLAAPLRESGFEFPLGAHSNHAEVTYVCLAPALEQEWELDDFVAMRLAACVAAHHGSFPVDQDLAAFQLGGGQWDAIRAAAVRQVLTLFGARHAPAPLRGATRVRDAWAAQIAGLTCVCDWIASHRPDFPYARHGASNPADYLEQARTQARMALRRIGWTDLRERSAAQAHEAPTFSQMFPDFEPNAMQQICGELADSTTGPSLVLVEAPTGSGKTEAALFMAQRWLARSATDGLFYALPTRATSDQMFRRVVDFLAHLHVDNPTHVQLVHGAASAHPHVRALVEPRSVDGPTGARDDAVRIESWFRAKKHALLAPYAVGTVDQALLAAVASRHFFVRHWGLSHKVLVIDEVHAYDAFMSTILDSLLRWLRAHDCHVVLLSATLPATRRAELLRCWGATPGDPGSVEGAAAAVSHVSESGAMRRIALSGFARRTLTIRAAAASADAIAADLLARVQAGAFCAWICNTVAAAQEAYLALARAGLPAERRWLLHSRMPMSWRRAREAQVMGLAGLATDSSGQHRAGVVVSTQILEQSLDIDFDVMVSELAPIDLLLQRAGRLHRHARPRPAGATAPVLHVVGLDTTPDGADAFGSSGWIYAPYILLRTWMAWQHASAGDLFVTLPDDTRDLIESVYGAHQAASESCPTQPSMRALLDELHQSFLSEMRRAREKPVLTLVPAPDTMEDGFEVGWSQRSLLDPDESAGAHPTHVARTRDIDYSAQVICLFGNPLAASLAPDGEVFGVESDWQSRVAELLEHGMSLSGASWVRTARGAASTPPAWKRHSALRHHVVVYLDRTSHCCEVGDAVWKLDSDLGLVRLAHAEAEATGTAANMTAITTANIEETP